MFDPARKYPFPDALRPDGAPAPHPQLAPVTGLLGTWSGRGRGGYPTLDEEFTYEQEVTFSHDGRPFLHYEARAWLIDADGTPLRPSARESGWWRLQPEGRVEALVTQPTGIAEILVGRADAGTVDLATHTVALAPTAKEVEATPVHRGGRGHARLRPRPRGGRTAPAAPPVGPAASQRLTGRQERGARGSMR